MRRSVRARSWSNREAPGITRGAGYKMMLPTHECHLYPRLSKIRPVVRQGGTQVETDKTEVVPCFATCVVKNDEGATGCDGVG